MTTEQKHTITIPGLPDNYQATSYRPAHGNEKVFSAGRIIQIPEGTENTTNEFLIVEEILRRITLIETKEGNEFVPDFAGGIYKDQFFLNGKLCISDQPKLWRIQEAKI